MSLNLEGREKLREFVEEQLKKVPAGKRLVLPNETLEQLLFEEVVVNEKEDIRVKFPVWSGKFLRKLDLSRVSFENVDWACLWFLAGQEHFRDNYDNIGHFIGIFTKDDVAPDEHREIYDDENMFKNRVKGVQGLKRLYDVTTSYGGVIDYSGTNATIDLSQSFLSKYSRKFWVFGCNFSGCNVYISNSMGFTRFEISDCNFSNTQIKLPKILYEYNDVGASNFENCDLSGIEFDLTDMLANEEEPINLKNTGAKITYDLEYIEQDLLDKYMDTLLVGCYLDGELIRTPEERERIKREQANLLDKQQLEELQRMFGEISSTISSQLDEETPKTM